jgi:tRNA dimethylallyltransferase
MNHSHPLIFIVGPTGTGKSALAMDLARQNKGCILNADSIQLYEGLKIGSAAPSDIDRSEIDHFLFQVVKKGEVWTASEYQERAYEIALRELNSRPVIVVGGSGFYVQALEKGMGTSKSESLEVKENLEKELALHGSLPLFKELQKSDPKAAERIHPNDHYRLLRALGYFRTYQRPFSEDQILEQPRHWPTSVIKVGISVSQSELKILLKKRAHLMLESGFISEVRDLIAEGLSEWAPLNSVGYKEVRLFLDGQMGEEVLLDEITQKTLSLAKRQKTWFKRDPAVKWFSVGERDQALRWILDHLA